MKNNNILKQSATNNLSSNRRECDLCKEYGVLTPYTSNKVSVEICVECDNRHPIKSLHPYHKARLVKKVSAVLREHKGEISLKYALRHVFGGLAIDHAKRMTQRDERENSRASTDIYSVGRRTAGCFRG